MEDFAFGYVSFPYSGLHRRGRDRLVTYLPKSWLAGVLIFIALQRPSRGSAGEWEKILHLQRLTSRRLETDRREGSQRRSARLERRARIRRRER